MSEVKLFVQNSRAIYDSLMRFQDAKINLSLKNNQISNYQTQVTGCQIQNSKLRSDANDMAVRLFDANEANQILHRRFRRADIERWAWRIGAAAILYLKFK
ncbi:hypothetical protein [Runella sp.]|uniref:hypothetical protein n=1 Tax=Runella sp. TaxID=1960881 RepID=UPI003D1306B2